MSTPLFDGLRLHIAKGNASFHTPGHKGRADILRDIALAYDLTELPDTGSLYDGGDAVEAAEKLAAAAFGASRTLFSAGGCTLCIQAMITIATGGSGKIAMARHSHRAAVHTAVLLGLDIVWLWPEDFGAQTDPRTVQSVLEKEKDIRAVYLTSPDYFGRCSDISTISAVCRTAGVKLIVDNAHGSHLGAFGLHPLQCGADMSADSCHKTLPVMTGGAMLHLAADETPGAKQAMALFGSTSPPFPVLASLDIMRSWWETGGDEAFRRLAGDVYGIEAEAAEHGLHVPLSHGTLRDPVRLTLDMASAGMEGGTAAEWFRGMGCEPEYSDDRRVVFILTPFNTAEERTRLKAAVSGFPLSEPVPEHDIRLSAPEIVMTPREAFLSRKIRVPVSEACGRIAAQAVCPCPPGIPVVMPGEVINRDVVELFLRAGVMVVEAVNPH